MGRAHSYGFSRARVAFLPLLAAGALVGACSKDGGGGASDSGASTGGGSGAAGSTSGGSGGAAQAGGATSSGGATMTGGTSNSAGGATASSGGSAGTTASGGASSGGATNSGGAANGGVAGATDAGTDAGADPCATALFCENFESYATGKAPGGGWKTSTNMGTVSVVDTAQLGGTKAVECTTQAGANSKTAYIKLDLASVFPVKGNAFYGRMMTRLDAAPDTSVHWTFLQASGLIPGQNYHAIYRYGGQLPVKNGDTFVGTKLMANYDTPDNYSGTGPASDCWNHANNDVVMPVAKWTCVEWQFDGPNDTLRFWLDGAPVDSLTVQGTGQGCVHQDKTYEWKAPTFDNLELGWESYQMDTARTLYVDDVVVSTKRVFCPAKP
ncbi:MAG TPA: hypothetical protein VH062_31290 [Polyangiaceae bacterium]|jgi:hypothetical protein|nr:hypothetical protein [Polyangiaceae bacterium]